MNIKKYVKIIVTALSIILIIIISLKVSKNWRLTHYKNSDYLDITFGVDKMRLPIHSHTYVIGKTTGWTYGCLSYTNFPQLKYFYGTSLNYLNETGEYREDYKIKEFTANKLIVQKDNYEIEFNLIASDLHYINYTVNVNNYNKAKSTNKSISTVPAWYKNLTIKDVIDAEDIIIKYNRFMKAKSEITNPYAVDEFKTNVAYNNMCSFYFPADDTTNPYDKYELSNGIPIIGFKVENYDKSVNYVYLKKIDNEWKVFDIQ